jgi:hypothetical protein
MGGDLFTVYRIFQFPGCNSLIISCAWRLDTVAGGEVLHNTVSVWLLYGFYTDFIP